MFAEQDIENGGHWGWVWSIEKVVNRKGEGVVDECLSWVGSGEWVW